ncbi:MAG: hypothetical protein ACR2LJ_05735 [Acidimicrobiales bacterium]
MPRIDIELTSAQPGGAWTWRAAGARQPKGVLEGTLLDSGAQVGDVLRAECEIDLDGTRVTSVVATRTKRREPERLAIRGSDQEGPLVTQDGGAPDLRGERPRREGRSGRDRDGGGRPGGSPGGRPSGPGGGRGGFPAGGRPGGAPSGGRGPGAPGGGRPADGRRADGRPGGSPGEAPGGGRSPGTRPPGARGDRPTAPGAGERGSRPPRGGDGRRDDRQSRDQPQRLRRARPEPSAASAAARPRPKRLQPGRVHRESVLADLPPEQRPVAEKVLRGGLPSVRQAVEEQNAEARSTGAPEVRADALMAMAEGLLPRLRAAEWRDRAEAAAADFSEIGLRDLRAVVAGSDAAGRDDESRALAGLLREALERRSAEERESWVAEIRTSLVDGRVVRALRLSGRPPDPGARFPADLAEQLSAAAGAAMTADTVADRWAALLDAVVASPVRRTVQPHGVPAERAEDLERALRLAAPRVPGLAAMLGPPRPPRPVAPGDARPRPAGSRPPRRRGPGGERRPSPAPPPAPGPDAVEAPAVAPPAPSPGPDAVEAPPGVPAERPGDGSDAAVPAPSGDDGDDAVLVEKLR